MEITQEKEISLPDSQVVTTARSKKNTPPPSTQLFGERDQTVEKQTTASRSVQRTRPSGSAAHTLTLKDFLSPDPARAFEGETKSGSSTDAYVPGVEAGIETYLNTRRYAHWMFLERIRAAIAPQWKQDIRKRVSDLNFAGLKLSREEMVSKVEVKLDEEGKVRSIVFLESSGSESLDAAATAAFEKAKQFPNPPKALVAEDGMVRVRWTFTVRQPQIKLTYSPSKGNKNRSIQ
jgi:TonB family protein